MERAMKRTLTLSFWFLGLVLLAASLIGTTWVLHSRAGEGTPSTIARTTRSRAMSEAAVCVGHVDVERGIQGLYPVQPGKVVEVPVHEDANVKAGTVLLSLDDRQARFLVRQAEADLKAAW